MSRSKNIRVNKAFHMPEPDYRWRVSIPGMEPVNVVAKTCYEALEAAGPVFGQPSRSMRFRGSCVLLGLASDPEPEEMPEESGDEPHPDMEVPDWPPPEMKEPRLRSRR